MNFELDFEGRKPRGGRRVFVLSTENYMGKEMEAV